MTKHRNLISFAKPLMARASLLAAAGLLAVSSLPAQASPLREEHVPADSKWLVHLDVDAFRQGRIGKFVVDKLIEGKLAEVRLALPIQFDFSATNINAITLFGSEYDGQAAANAKVETGPKTESEGKSDETNTEPKKPGNLTVEVKADSGKRGAVLIQTDKVTAGKLDKLINDLIRTNAAMGLSKMEASYPLYKAKDDTLFSVRDNGMVLISKSSKDMETAQAVLTGKGENIVKSKAFAAYPTITNSFFFLGIAEAFNMGDNIPPQAKVLQQADGGRLVLGETAEKLFLQISLRTKTPEASQQIQQVVQGLIAIVSLGTEEPEVLQLVQSAKLTSTDNLVTLGLDLPVAKAMAKIEEEVGDDN